jgi:AcrR family transcriptional regulator
VSRWIVPTTEISAGTRERILSAAWRRVRRGGVAAVTVTDVATDAGVSRQLVYFHYRNRAGLLVAMARHHDRTSGFDRRVQAATALPPAEAFEALVRAWLDYLRDVLPVARALEAAAITGDVGGEAWRDRMTALRETLRHALVRLADAGRLREPWTADDAADWAWSRVHPATWAHLVEERGWTAAAFADRTLASLTAELVAAQAAAQASPLA